MTTRLLICVLAAATLLAACGGDDDVDTATETTGEASDQEQPSSETSSPDGPTTADADGDDTASAAGNAPVPEFFDFTLEDVRGGEVGGASFAGSDVIVWFWAPWCTKCNQQAAAIAALAAERDDVEFLGMAGLDGKSSAEDFVARHGLDGFPHAFDEAGDSWQAFGITSQSSFAFVDDDGTFETESYVTLGGDEIEERIDRLVAG